MAFVGIVASGLISGGYYRGGGASDINFLKTIKTIHITFTSYITEKHETTYFALQVKRTSSLLTVRRSASL